MAAASIMAFLYTASMGIYILILVIVCSAADEVIIRVDPLALLSATLRTYHKTICDTNQIVIACPRGTSISIEYAQYNKFINKDNIMSMDELCTIIGNGDKPTNIDFKYLISSAASDPTPQPANSYSSSSLLAEKDNSSLQSKNTVNAFADDVGSDSLPKDCMWPNALQYSLLQTVVETCQKKKRCKINSHFHHSQNYGQIGKSSASYLGNENAASSSNSTEQHLGDNPCPERTRLVEVAYKCRPYEFRSKVACHNDIAQLECNPYSRIAVYSASFGRTEYESIQCPQPQGVQEETCLASYATETVMKICHGRRRCNLAADANTFGTPCKANSKMYLKVVYTCVPKQVLMEHYDSELEIDEPELETDNNDLYDDEFYNELEAIPKLYSNTTASSTRHNSSTANSTLYKSNFSQTNNSSFGIFAKARDEEGGHAFISHSKENYLKDDQERLLFYLITAGSIGILLGSVAIIVKVFSLRNEESSEAGTSPVKVAGTSALEDLATGNDVEIMTIRTEFIEKIPSHGTTNLQDLVVGTTPHTITSLPNTSHDEEYDSFPNETKSYVSGCNFEPASRSQEADARNCMLSSPLLRNSGMPCRSRQSPDILGISSQLYDPSNASNSITSRTTACTGPASDIIKPVITLAATNTSIVSTSNSVINTIPIASLTGFGPGPGYKSSYLLETDGVHLQRTMDGAQPLVQEQFEANSTILKSTPVLRSVMAPLFPTTSVQHSVQSTANTSLLSQESKYDSTVSRTQPTGIPLTSQFYYG